MGLACAKPAIDVCHRTFCPFSTFQTVGASIFEAPAPCSPRNCGQFSQFSDDQRWPAVKTVRAKTTDDAFGRMPHPNKPSFGGEDELSEIPPLRQTSICDELPQNVLATLSNPASRTPGFVLAEPIPRFVPSLDRGPAALSSSPPFSKPSCQPNEHHPCAFTPAPPDKTGHSLPGWFRSNSCLGVSPQPK